MWISFPHLAAGFAEIPARQLLAEMRKGTLLSKRFFDIAARSKTYSMDWSAEGRGWASLGLLYFTEARRAGLASDDGQAKLAQSVTADRNAVSLSPGQAYAWTRLAHAEILKDKASPQVGLLIERAIVQAPYDPALVFGRLELSFLAWRNLNSAQQAVVADQIRFAASIAPKRLAVLSRKRYAMLAVRNALIDTPLLRRQVDYYLRRL